MSTTGGALGWGVVAGSSFVVGGAIASRSRVKDSILGWIMAVGAGALMGAVSYELVDEAGRLAGGTGWVGVGLLLGGAAYVVAIRPRDREDPTAEAASFGLPDLVSPVMSVVPEGIVIVGSLLGGHGVSFAVITAVFLCGVPESMWWAERQRAVGTPRSTIVAVAIAFAVLTGVTAAVAHGLLHGATPGAIAFTLAAAGGAVLTNLGADLVPEARMLAGHRAGIGVVIGFALVFGLVEVV